MAHVLLVNLELTGAEHADAFLEAIAPLVAASREEAGTLSYEVSLDESRTKVLIFERYVNQAALTEVHQQSAAFKAFVAHPIWAHVKGSPAFSSFTETGVGFITK